MKTKLIKLALSFFSSDDSRKFVRNVAVVIVSPFVAITVLIGAIFSDGISFNHNLVTDLFEGNPISELTDEMKQYVQEIQDGLVLIDSHIDKINQFIHLLFGKCCDCFSVISNQCTITGFH